MGGKEENGEEGKVGPPDSTTDLPIRIENSGALVSVRAFSRIECGEVEIGAEIVPKATLFHRLMLT